MKSPEPCSKTHYSESPAPIKERLEEVGESEKQQTRETTLQIRTSKLVNRLDPPAATPLTALQELIILVKEIS